MNTFTRLISLLCLLLSTQAAFSQTPPNLIWAKSFGGTATEFVQKVAVDATGNVYATGYYQGTVNFDASQTGFTRTSQGSNDVFVAKYSPTSSAIWVRAFGGTAAESGVDITLDANGNVIVVGAYASATMVIDSPSVDGVSSVGSRDIFMVSFDSNGGYNWSKSMGGAGEDIPTAVEIDQMGHIYITGLFYGTSDFNPSSILTNNLTASGITYDAFLAKYTGVGTYIWALKVGGNDVDAAYGLAIAPDNDVVITGKMRQTVNFDPTGTFNITVSGYEDAFVAGYTPTGALRYAFNFGGFSSTDVVAGNHIAFDSEKSMYISGIYKGTVDFNPSPSGTANFGASTRDIFISKIDSLGQFQWVRTMPTVNANPTGDEVVNDMVIDHDDNILITGLMYETVEFGYPATNQLSSHFGSDIFLAKYNPAGHNSWAFRIGATNDGGYSIGIDSNNDIYLGGYFTSTIPSPVDFDPTSGTTLLSSINGNPDMFIAKYSETSSGCSNTTATITATACDVYDTPSGNYLYASGTYVDTIPNSDGCDSIITINLTVNQSALTTIYPNLCLGQVYYAPDGVGYISGGFYTAYLPMANGCDSVINIELTEVIVDASVSVQANGLLATTTRPNVTFQWVDCDNGNTPINGETAAGFAPTGTGSYGVNVTLGDCTEFSGCFTINVACVETYGTLTTSTCGNFVSPSGNYIWQVAGTYEDTIANAAGCDSIITIELTVGSLDVTVSQGDDFVIVAATDAGYQWLDCDNGNTPIAGATSRSFTPTANGNYAVIVNQSTCNDTSACFTFTAVGINEVQHKVGISLYPNPANTTLQIELSQPEGIEVYNMLGALMARYSASETFSIDVSHYAQGVYLVKAGNSIKRFVKE